MQIDLTPDDAKLLGETLESVLGDLRYEINNTDAAGYRKDLRARLETLERIIASLSHA